jgi:transposase-like protein
MDNNNMNIKQTMQLLGIQEVTTKRQKKNGTREFELPIKDAWSSKKIRVASFKTGYVRNQNSASSNYQLNKTKKSFVKEYDNGYKYYSTERILIPNEQDRLKYLISYCLKNYYIGKANQVANGDYIPKWKYDNLADAARLDYEKERLSVSVNINGHRYNVI